LIVPGGKIARSPTVPFLATMVCPPWHRNVDQPIVKLAFRLRNAVAMVIMRSEWFSDDETRTARLLHREASRPIPVKCKFDKNNPDPWLGYRLSLDTNIHPLARRAMFHVCKALLQER